MDSQSVIAELDAAAADFYALVDSASVADLSTRSNGTRWTNRQLLFHMLFGYLIVRALLGLVRFFGVLPRPASRWFAAALNVTTPAFHVINFVGSLAGARVLGRTGMKASMRRVTSSLARSLGRTKPETLAHGMHFPRGWDPYFLDYMTLLEVYHYGSQHYEHHRRQLTLTSMGQYRN